MSNRGNVRRSAARRRVIALRAGLIVAGALGITWFGLQKFYPQALEGLTGGSSSPIETAKPKAVEKPMVAVAKPVAAPLLKPVEEDLPLVNNTEETAPDPYEEFARFVRKNPQSAALDVAKLGEGEERDAKLAILLEVWAEANPGSAAAWVDGLASGEFRGEAAEYLARQWALSDPLATAAWVESNIQSGREPSGAAVFAATWASSDSKAAMEWADKLENPKARWESYGAIGNQLGIDDPQAAIDWMSGVDDVRLRDAIATGLISSWSHKDPVAAANWLKGDFGADGEPIRLKSSFILVNQWTADDPYAASFWVNDLPAGELKEGAKISLAKSLSTDAPEEAIIWAKSIKDKEQSDDAVLTIYEDWIEEDPAGFKQGLIKQWPTFKEPEFRKEVYQLLYDYDPSFKEEVFQLLENAINEPAVGTEGE